MSDIQSIKKEYGIFYELRRLEDKLVKKLKETRHLRFKIEQLKKKL